MVDGFSSADPSLARGSQKPATSFKKMLKKRHTNNLIFFAVTSLILFSFISATNYSSPTYQDGTEIEWGEITTIHIKNDCPRDEWNNNFEKYRNGIISKKEMKNYVRGCKW